MSSQQHARVKGSGKLRGLTALPIRQAGSSKHSGTGNSVPSLRTWHLLLGGLGLLLFLLSGQYMAHVAASPELPDAQRMIYRASHIYLLLACVSNIAVGAFMQPGTSNTALQRVCSLVLMVALVLLCWSFFVEATRGELERPTGRIALYLLFGAASALLLHALFDSYAERRDKN